MKIFHHKSIRIWRVLVSVLLIAPGIMGIDANSVFAAGKQIPFSGSYSGGATFAADGTPLFSGTGSTTQLGRTTIEGYSVFVAGSPNCSGGIPNDNYETLTAANGDSLSIVSHDVACPIGPYQYHGTGNWVVVSGTGRFKDASGQGTFDGQSDFNRGVFSLRLSGSISTPNAE